MVQIKSNFSLKSETPNFDRDTFDTIEKMLNYNINWIDYGHISFCKATQKHYKFIYNHEMSYEENIEQHNIFLEGGGEKKDDAGRFGFGYWRELIGKVNTNYVSQLNGSDVVTTTDLGGIKKGESLGNIDGETISKLLDDILFVKTDPEIILPSVKISLKQQKNIYKVGDLRPSLDNDDFNWKVDRGEVKLNGINLKNKNSGNEYAGEPKSSTSELPDSQPSKRLYCKYNDQDEEFIESKFNNPGIYIFTGASYLGNGNLIPKNSFGEELMNKVWTAGWTNNSNELVVLVTKPVYKLVGSEMKECPLIPWNNDEMEIELELQSTIEGSLKFKLPRKLKKIYLFLCGNYVEENIVNYNESTESGELGIYYIYNYACHEQRGAVKLKLYF